MGKKRCRICKTKPSNSGLSNHHLIPKFNGNIRSGKTPLCVDCHRRIHEHFSNRELFERFNTLESLRHELANRMLREALDGFNFLLEEVETTQASVAESAMRPPCIINAGERDDVGSSPITGFQPSIERSYETIGSRL